MAAAATQPASRPAFMAFTMPPPDTVFIMCAASPATSTPAGYGCRMVVLTQPPATAGRCPAGPDHPHPPPAVRLARHPGRFRAHAELGPQGHGPVGEKGVEPRAIENPADVALGDLHLCVVGRDEHDAGDLAGGPASAVGVGELPQTRVPHPFGATDRRPNPGVTL